MNKFVAILSVAAISLSSSAFAGGLTAPIEEAPIVEPVAMGTGMNTNYLLAAAALVAAGALIVANNDDDDDNNGSSTTTSTD